LTSDEIVFDLIGAEPPLANALRRIMIAEIPTIAIERVTMWQNTSIIPDENLAHRVGLIPLKVDPRKLEDHQSGTDYTENDSLDFKLHVKCTPKTKDVPRFITSAQQENELLEHGSVFSGDLQWIPKGNQAKDLGEVGPLHDDILIAKLRPG